MEIPQGNFLCSYLKKTKISFVFLLQNQRNSRTEQVLSGGLIPVEGRRGGERE
jgi:hypothetical protein